MDDEIYVGDFYILLHTKYISCGLHGFRKDFIFMFFPVMEATSNDSQSMAKSNPRGMVGMIYIGMTTRR